MANKPWLLESPSRQLGDVGRCRVPLTSKGRSASTITATWPGDRRDRPGDHEGLDAVKFQKRTPEICTPPDQWDLERDTPWGRMTYIDYRHRVEFGVEDYAAIDEHAKRRGIAWFASPWDNDSVDFLEAFDVPAHKVASACLTDDDLLRRLRATGRTIILSTGMSTMRQIRHAVEVLGSDNIIMCHATSTYPAQTVELNLKMINTLQGEFPNVPIGYSGHETGLQTTLAAVAIGAVFVERHITLDRSMWGSDQAASVEPQGLGRLVRDVRVISEALGDGVKRVYDGERAAMKSSAGCLGAGRSD